MMAAAKPFHSCCKSFIKAPISSTAGRALQNVKIHQYTSQFHTSNKKCASNTVALEWDEIEIRPMNGMKNETPERNPTSSKPMKAMARLSPTVISLAFALKSLAVWSTGRLAWTFSSFAQSAITAMVKWAIRVRNLVGTMTSLDDDAMLKRFLDYSEKALGPRQRTTKYGMDWFVFRCSLFLLFIDSCGNDPKNNNVCTKWLQSAISYHYQYSIIHAQWMQYDFTRSMMRSAILPYGSGAHSSSDKTPAGLYRHCTSPCCHMLPLWTNAAHLSPALKIQTPPELQTICWWCNQGHG